LRTRRRENDMNARPRLADLGRGLALRLALAAAALAAPACTRGLEGRRCFPNDTCYEGLACLSHRCVVAAPGAGDARYAAGGPGGSRRRGADPAPARRAPPALSAADVGEDGWLVSGGARDTYAVRRDPAVKRDGRATLLLEPFADTDGRYGTWMRSIDAAPYRGKRVRISGFTKTAGATARVDFWARVQAVDSPGDGPGLGGGHLALPPDSDWTERVLVFDVDPAGHRLQYGVGLAGPGRLWLDAPRVEVVAAAPAK
jgi:hypothetical protein